MKRDEGGHGKACVNTAEVNGRASGVACNALLGGPGAAVTLRYMLGSPASIAFSRLTARGAIATQCSRARGRRVHLWARVRSGWRSDQQRRSNGNVVRISRVYSSARSSFGARRASLRSRRGAARVVGGAQCEYMRDILLVYTVLGAVRRFAYHSERLVTATPGHVKICPAATRVHRLIGAR